jgi:hypothetical protein
VILLVCATIRLAQRGVAHRELPAAALFTTYPVLVGSAE